MRIIAGVLTGAAISFCADARLISRRARIFGIVRIVGILNRRVVIGLRLNRYKWPVVRYFGLTAIWIPGKFGVAVSRPALVDCIGGIERNLEFVEFGRFFGVLDHDRTDLVGDLRPAATSNFVVYPQRNDA